MTFTVRPGQVTGLRRAERRRQARNGIMTFTATGLVTDDPDGLPYIGRIGHSPRMFLAAGHNMLGFSLAPATGDRIAALITGAIDDSALASFAPGR
jgi:glycine/D-amino acid oxidase-like deaminating enzyme